MSVIADPIQDGPRVLHEISFEVKSGERVGIGKSQSVLTIPIELTTPAVGRTGSGKVSVTPAEWS